jgi:hypothetical protein
MKFAKNAGLPTATSSLFVKRSEETVIPYSAELFRHLTARAEGNNASHIYRYSLTKCRKSWLEMDQQVDSCRVIWLKAVTSLIYIRKVRGSSLGRDTNYLARVFRDFPQSLPAYTAMVT